MKYNDLCEYCSIKPSDIEEMVTAGLLESSRNISGENLFTDDTIRDLNKIITLKNAGLDYAEIKEIQKLEGRGGVADEDILKILRNERCRRLNALHESQKSIDRLDYLIYEIKERNVRDQ